MANYFYFDQTNQKHGPIDEQQLRELAAAGIVRPNTPMETVDGHKGTAKQIPGLQFTTSAISTTSTSTVPEWYGKVAITCGIVCILLTLSGWWRWSFLPCLLLDITFVVGMFFGCRGMSANKTIIAKIGLILCIIAFVMQRQYWFSMFF
jgi:hypothetical protein